MHLLFWFSLTAIAYAYAGYAGLLAIQARVRPRPFQRAPLQPMVSIVIAAHNEAATLPGKLNSLRALQYPKDRVEIVIVSDGSADGTHELLKARAPEITPILLPVPVGKAMALNQAVASARGEVLVFMDARQKIESEAVNELVSCFADPSVGAVSGELHLETANGAPSPDALGLYWKLEKLVRRLESETGSVVGVTGALFAMRRELFVPLPPGTLLDDVLTPMQVARQGKRVLFLDTAIAHDRIFIESGKEFSRKVRTLTGNYQLLQLAPWLLSASNPLLFRFISHKLLRLAVPFFLVILLISSTVAGGLLYRCALALQLAVYLLALLGTVRPATRRFRGVSVSYTFAMLNVAAGMAFYNFLAGRARWT